MAELVSSAFFRRPAGAGYLSGPHRPLMKHVPNTLTAGRIVAAPAALPERVHDLWTSTPQGAVKAAARQRARAGVRRDFLRRWDTLSFELPGQFSATLDEHNRAVNKYQRNR